jgi:hypothetical protein
MNDLKDNEYDLTIYVPTKGRPERLQEFADQFYSTAGLSTRAVFILSTNDPKIDEYRNKLQNVSDSLYIEVTPDKPGFVEPLNLGYLADRKKFYSYAVGFMGDDHRPRVKFWDEMMVDALITMRSGFVYGDDGFQHEAIPTHVAMTADIPLALGYMTYPDLWHLYADNFWLDLGSAVKRIRYFPEVLIEHMHPAAGKNVHDEGYEFSGSYALDLRDKQVYNDYLKEQLHVDAQKIRTMLRQTGKE